MQQNSYQIKRAVIISSHYIFGKFRENILLLMFANLKFYIYFNIYYD